MRFSIFRGMGGVFGIIGMIAFGARSDRAAEPDFRTDINPALLYFQAFQNMPQLNEADSAYLLNTPGPAWPSQIDERKRELLKRYDNCFKLVHRARFSRVPCDWGYDLSDGPEALLPGLAPAKRVAQLARLRAAAALDEGRFDAALDDVASAYVLARNLSTDHILISCLMEFAMENHLTTVASENYYRLSPDQLDQLVAAFDAAPPRGSLAHTIGVTEREAFYGYILRKVQAIAADAKGEDERFWPTFAAFWNPIATDAESKTGPDPSAERVKEAAGGTAAGVLRLLEEMPPLYAETARVMALPYLEYKAQAPALFERIDNSPNPFVRQFFAVFKKIRAKEFATIVWQEMLRAAAAYKRGGLDAFKTVQDPVVGGPFEFSRFEFEGADRGFELKPRERLRDFDEALIFVEKPGKRFLLDGPRAGTAP